MLAASSEPASAVSPSAQGRARAARFLFYSNEMVGLGHLRRTLSIAGCLARAHDDLPSLIHTGSSLEPYFAIPPRPDTVKLPVLRRAPDGPHHSRRALDFEERKVL